jgi:hypothetical protein
MRAYWKDRKPQLGMCSVKEINFEDNNACISNGSVRVFPNLDEIIIMHKTGEKDHNDVILHDLDIVQVNNLGTKINGVIRFAKSKYYIEGFENITLHDMLFDKYTILKIGNLLENPELV